MFVLPVLVDLLEPGVLALDEVAFLVHLGKYLVLLGGPGYDLVDLVVIGYLCLLLLLVLHVVVLPDEVLEALLPVIVVCLVVEHARLDDLVVQVLLLRRLVEDALLDLSRRDQTVNPHLLLLPDSMSSILSLLIHLGVPVRVENDDSVRHLQVQTMPTSAGTEQEYLFLRIPVVEDLEVACAVFLLHGTVQSQVLDAAVVKEILHDVHQLSELRKDQHLVTRLDQLGQDPVQKLEFPARPEDVVAHVSRLQIIQEQVRVIANLSELHHSVAESDLAKLAGRWISGKDPVFLYAIVHDPLPGREVNLDDHFDLVGELLLDLTLYTSEEEGSEDLMESVNDEKLLFLAELEGLLLIAPDLAVGHRVHL